MKLLRVTKHEATPEQERELHRIFGDNIKVIQVDEQFPRDARAAVARFDELAEEHSAEIVEAVLPLPIVQEILQSSKFIGEKGGQLIKAIMKGDRQGVFEFSHYERLIEVKIVSERL